MNSTGLLKIIEADAAKHVSFLQAFVQAASPNPPGNTQEAANVIIKYLQAHSLEPEIIIPYPDSPNIVSDFVCGSSPGPRLILNGHIDVFPVGDGSGWSCDPWSGEIANGRLYGRGTVDMKAGTAASVIAYTYLYKYRHYLKGSVGLCAVSDEETGGKYGSRYLLSLGERWKGDCMINAEPGGLGTIRFAEKGTLRLTFTIQTEGAHGAYIHRSKGAIRIASSLISDLANIEDITPNLDPALKEYLKRPKVRDAIDLAMGKGATDIIVKPTLNIGIIQGGLKVNMIPSQCTFQADIRLPIGLTQATVLSHINKILESYPETTLEVQTAASNPAASCAHDHPMVHILKRTAKRFGEDVTAIPSLGATDCKFWRYENVPAYVYGVSPEGMASVNESVNLEEFQKVVKTYVCAAWEFLGGETEKA